MEAEKRGLKLRTILRAKKLAKSSDKIAEAQGIKEGRYNPKSLHLPCPVNKVRHDGEQEVSTRWIAPVTLLLYATVRMTQFTVLKEITEKKGLPSGKRKTQGASAGR